jgi:monoamine oxidase
MADRTIKHAIIGGGLAGLYCAYHMSRSANFAGQTIDLFESTDRLGGRIQSWRIDAHPWRADGNGNEIYDDYSRVKIRTLLKNDTIDRETTPDMLVAEFGPMRIEPDHQPYLKRLLDHLGIKNQEPGREKWSDLIPFSPYQGPPPEQPQFKLEDEEQQQESLIDLLLLALRRIFEVVVFRDHEGKIITAPWKLDAADGQQEFREANFYWQEFKTPTHLHRRFWKRSLMQWLLLLDEPQYKYIFDHAEFRGTLLKYIGFWNVISAVLSHMATVKLRDWASFYHLLPENPNAAAWIIFWLRGIKTSRALKGIRGGTDFVIHRLCKELNFEIAKEESEERHYVVYKGGKRAKKPKAMKTGVNLYLKWKLMQVEEKDNGIELTFEKTTEDGVATTETRLVTGHVILALPKSPLQRVRFKEATGKVDAALQTLIDTVTVIPLLKCFFLVEDPFWPDDRPANMYAHTTPTRELHYWKSADKKLGLMMIYTDRPGLQYWSDLNWPDLLGGSGASGKDGIDLHEQLGSANRLIVPVRYQDHAKIWRWKNQSGYQDWRNEKFENDRLLRTFLLYAKEEGAESVTADRVLAAGMHDWGLRPYENACHAWRSGSPATEIIEYFSAFSLKAGVSEDEKKLHICGEAYSDYQGFMEGALRSAVKVLEKQPFAIKQGNLVAKSTKRLRTTKFAERPGS